MKMEEKVEENGAQIEFRQEVEKIFVKDGKVTGVRTRRGDEIACDYVICGAYPNRVFTSMIEPLSEVPEAAIKFVNGMELGVCPVSVMLILAGTPEENGFVNYNTFSGDTMDTNAIWENAHNLSEPYNFLTTVCLNYANEMIDKFIEHNGVDFRDRIAEIEVSTPMTISHYVGAWKGAIYGYRHSMKNHIIGRRTMDENAITQRNFSPKGGISFQVRPSSSLITDGIGSPRS